MKQFLLSLFSSKTLWREILRREGFSVSSTVESSAAWSEVYHRVPLIKEWLKKREHSLLSSMTLQDKKSDFVLGQICENRLYRAFDGPPNIAFTDFSKVDEKIKSEDEFLAKWENNANTSKENALEKKSG
jgi:hypothetical protein